LRIEAALGERPCANKAFYTTQCRASCRVLAAALPLPLRRNRDMKPLAMSTAKTPLRGHRSLGLDYAAVRELMPTARLKDCQKTCAEHELVFFSITPLTPFIILAPALPSPMSIPYPPRSIPCLPTGRSDQRGQPPHRGPPLTLTHKAKSPILRPTKREFLSLPDLFF